VNLSHAPKLPAPPPREALTPAVVVERALVKEGLAHVRFLLRLFRVSQADRDDLAQEILLAVYAKRHEYEARRGTFKQWLQGFVMNSVRHYWRTSGKGAGRNAELPPHLADATAGVEEQTMAEQLRRLLHEELFPQVELDLRTVVIAHDIHDLHFETIARHQGVPISTVHDRYQRGIAQLQTAYKRHQRQQKARGLIVLPLPLAQLLAADRVVPEISGEMVERAWSRLQRAIRWRSRGAAARALLRRPALHLAVTFVVGGSLGAVLALALRPRPHLDPVVFVQPLLAEPTPVVAITTAMPSPPPTAVAAPSIPQASSAIPSASSSTHRMPSAERQAFNVAYQDFLRGKLKEALAALNAQERDYPAGELAAERETLRGKIARLGDVGGL
jgi:RNA polymerase sigma factor (sigma-70 family)